MANAFRNKHFVARLCDDLLRADHQSKLPDYDSYQLVRRMDEVIPLSARRVRKHITGIAPPVPVVSDLVTVERRRKFLTSENRILNYGLRFRYLSCTFAINIYSVYFRELAILLLSSNSSE